MRFMIILVTVACVSVHSFAQTKPLTKPQTKPSPVLPPAPEGVTIQADVAYLPADRKEKPPEADADKLQPGRILADERAAQEQARKEQRKSRPSQNRQDRQARTQDDKLFGSHSKVGFKN